MGTPIGVGTKMWYAYCFTLAAASEAKDRSLDENVLDKSVAAFSEAVLAYFEGAGHWVAGTARAKNGGIEVWYSLPKLPAEKPFNEFWRAQLARHGLIALRVTGRA
jgi:hypothetical protein